MKILKKAIALTLCALTVGSTVGTLAACGNVGDPYGDTTPIQFANFQGGVGNAWLKEAGERFSKLKAEESYQNGKKGVTVSVTDIKAIPYDTITSSGYDIFTAENTADIYKMAGQGFLLDLSDIVENVNVKADAKKRLQAADGNYYALPHYEWYPGISYNVDYFEEQNLYFADPTETIDVREVQTDFGTARFVSSDQAIKSVGPNGERGDYDDGLPSSVQEFLQLCDSITGRKPLTIAGASLDYQFFFIDALWAALAGSEQMKTIYSLDSKGQAVVEAVTNTDVTTKLFDNVNANIIKPETEMIAIDETNGYKIYDQVARYYALATVQIIVEKDWFNTVSIGDTVSNLTAQSSFMTAVGNADNRTAMLWDGSYWYNESVAAENISFHQTMNPTNPDLNLSYMPMPTQLYGQVAEGEGKKNTLLDIGSAQLFVNQRVSEDPGLERACREFVEFLYSDAELAAFTEKTGQFRPIEYSYDKSKMSGFYQNMDAIRNKSDVVYFASDSELFKNNFTSFTLTWSGAINRPIIDGAEVAAGSIKAMRLHGTTKASAVNIFNLTRKTQSGWEQLIK